MIERKRISQMDAFLIETVRANGVSNQELLYQVEQGDVSGWEKFNTHFDFNGLVELENQDFTAFESIIWDGYSLKFVTLKGIQRLLELKFGIVNERDYHQAEKGLVGIQLKDNQLSELKEMLSQNWTVHEGLTNASDSKCSEISILLAYA